MNKVASEITEDLKVRIKKYPLSFPKQFFCHGMIQIGKQEGGRDQVPKLEVVLISKGFP